MKLSLFGVGNAGTRLVDQLLQAEAETGRNFTDGNVLAFNTAAEAFGETEALPEERQILIGDTHSAVNQYVEPSQDGPDTDAASATQRDSAGVDGDPELGATVADDELPEIRRALDLVDDTEVDAAMVVAGFGGGTGCGVSSVLLEELKSVYEIPVYVLGALPSTRESDERALTAARAVRTFVPLADAVLPVDNDTWARSTTPLDEQYEEINEAIATRVLSVFAAGESDPGVVSEMRIDPADVMRTLDVGGLASIGYSTIEVDNSDEGLVARLMQLLGLADETPDNQTDAATVKRLVRSALESKLTIPCDIESTDRVLLILSGPPKDISRKGFETGRYLLEEKTGTVEVLAGDEPMPNASEITATVLFSNVTDVPRIDELQERAVTYKQEQDAETEAIDTTTAVEGATALDSDTSESEADDDDEEQPFEFHGDGDERSENGDASGGDTGTETEATEDESESVDPDSAEDEADTTAADTDSDDDTTTADDDTTTADDDETEKEAAATPDERE
ncbi:cell division protein FtsZ [Halonotius terrestris]|uniref:Tubulin-like protein CetZ n=1 Tax=Halonotius terrestris TaxID=2487750 RepID=A0A8J8TB26_9EURY|nr:tubulin/FtsZ family protein [Halonotius terrestris]TQQ79998.1 cell division protein FtsZ [Halonotius terrestris]